MAYEGGGAGAETAVWELSSQPEQRKKEALRGILFIKMHEEYVASACHSILSSYTQN